MKDITTTPTAIDTDYCWNCSNDLGFKLRRCCGGHECGCMGWPIDEPWCSEKCRKEWYWKRDNPEHTVHQSPDDYWHLVF